MHGKSNSINREKILRTALALFSTKGIKSTTTKELAKKAKLAEGTIYVHFKSKDQIAEELFIHYMNELDSRLRDSIKTLTDPVSSLSCLIKIFFEFAEKEPKAAYFIVISHYTELNILKKEKYKFRKVFANVIKNGIACNKFIEINPDLGAALVIGMINRGILSYNEGLINMKYTKIISETTRAALKLFCLKEIR